MMVCSWAGCCVTRSHWAATLAFCRGAIRQHSTAEQFLQTSIKSFSWPLKAKDRLAPSTTRPCWITWSSFILGKNHNTFNSIHPHWSKWNITWSQAFLVFRMKSYIFYTHLLASMRSCSAHSLSERCCTSSRMFMVLWKWPQDRLTLTAVSCLSPVRTHTLIPASRRASMVSWTLSWSLNESRKKENALDFYSMAWGAQSPLFQQL